MLRALQGVRRSGLGRKSAILVACAGIGLTACGGSSGSTAKAKGGSSAIEAVKNTPIVSSAGVLGAVQSAQGLTKIPSSLESSLAHPEIAGPNGYFGCQTVPNPAHADPDGNCFYGDPTGKKLMVIYGDSHAAMWAASVEGVAAKAGWKLKVFGLGGCPIPDLAFYSAQTDAPNPNCTLYHTTTVATIRALHPQLVLLTSLSNGQVGRDVYPTASQWESGLAATIKSLTQTGTKIAMIGNDPLWTKDDADCLAAHFSDVQSCAVTRAAGIPRLNAAEAAAATAANIPYINTVPWICGAKCEPLINNQLVFYNQFHITDNYARYLTGVMQAALLPIMASA